MNIPRQIREAAIPADALSLGERKHIREILRDNKESTVSGSAAWSAKKLESGYYLMYLPTRDAWGLTSRDWVYGTTSVMSYTAFCRNFDKKIINFSELEEELYGH